MSPTDGLDVARNREIDDEQRLRTPAAGHRLDVRARDDRPLGAGGRDDDVGLAERRGHVGPRNGTPGDCLRQRFGVSGRAARDHDVADALAAEVLGRQRADFTGADDEHRASLQLAEDLPRR